ncbi:MAG TPA: methionyl-tRNA formyltransferase [Hyphomicrobiaceae bacterium]|jgi:methionyl-tRNA formyltransferase
MRIVFMGTPDFAVPTLAAVLAAGRRVAAVYTRAPRPAGRGMAERKSPVHLYADRAGLSVLTPRSLRDAAEQRAFAAHGADVGVVVAYGLILPRPVLEAPRNGCLNLHASALPRWRGAAPIARAIMAGDAATAAAIMRMEEGLDTGPVCLAEPVPIGADTTAGDLHDALAERGAELMVQALAGIERGTLTCTPQPDVGVTYAAKIDKAETGIDFTRPAGEVHNHVRGLSPFPGAWFAAGETRERIKVLRTRLAPGSGAPGTVLEGPLTIACGGGALQLLELQRAGKRPMAAAEFLRGFPLPPGTLLGG